MKTLNLAYLLMFFTATLIFSCGSEPTPEEKAADKISEGLEKMTEGLGDVAKEASKDLEGGLAGALSQLENAVEDLKEDGVGKKKPLNFRKFTELFPESPDGYTRSKPTGESTGMAGFNVSTAKVKYEKNDKKINVEIIDAGGLGMAMMGMAAWSMVKVDKETENGFERTTTYKGNKAFEKCSNTRCEFSVFVGKRFLMNVKGRNVDIDDLHDLVDEIGLKKLERMKDEEGE